MEESVQVKAKINEEDVYYYGRYSFFKRPITKLIIVTSIIVLLVLLSIIVLGHNFDVIPIFFVWLGLMGLIFFYTLPKSLKTSAQRSVSSSEFKNYERGYTFSSDGIEVKDGEEDSITLWKDIYNVVETKHNFQIYVDDLKAYLLPKRCFNEDNHSIDSFKNILIHNLPKEKLNIFK